VGAIFRRREAGQVFSIPLWRGARIAASPGTPLPPRREGGPELASIRTAPLQSGPRLPPQLGWGEPSPPSWGWGVSPSARGGAEGKGDAHGSCTMSKAKRFKQVVLPADRMFKRVITRDRSSGTRCSGILYWPAMDELRFPSGPLVHGHSAGSSRAQGVLPLPWVSSPGSGFEMGQGNEVLTEVVSVWRVLDGER